MTKTKKVIAAGKAVRVVVALGMVGYLLWDIWQRRNRHTAQVWAAGTDSID
ncbi:MAG: hypothetical protein K4304_05235 [Propionicimonas sp.]|jgi:predicted negative regulator of RcsB-dependent stress response